MSCHCSSSQLAEESDGPMQIQSYSVKHFHLSAIFSVPTAKGLDTKAANSDI